MNAVATGRGHGQGSSSQSSSENDPFGVNDESLVKQSDFDPYSIGLKTYDEVNSDLYDLGIKPDHLFFTSMIEIIAAYTSSDSIERRQRLETVFHDACTAGSASAKVVQALAQACPSIEMLQFMLGIRTWPIASVNVLPKEWTHNVPPMFKNLDSNKRGYTARKPFKKSGKSRQEGNRDQGGTPYKDRETTTGYAS